MDFKKMIKWGKTTKIVSIVAIALGGGLTIAGAAMLGVSGNKTYSMKIGGTTSIEFGVGFSNYGSWGGQYEPGVARPSYEDFIKVCREAVKNAPAGTTTELDMYKTAIQTYDIMVAGAVLLPIGALMAIIGTVFLVLNMKNLKSA